MPEDQAGAVHLITNTTRIHQKGKKFQSPRWTQAVDNEKERKDSSLTGRTGKNEGKGTGKGWGGTCNWGIWKRPPIWGSSSLLEAVSWDRRASILCGKRTQQQSMAAGQCETCTQVLTPCLPTHAWEGVHYCRQGLGAGMWGLENGPSRGLLWVLCESHPAGKAGREGSINRDVAAEAWTTIQHSTIADWWPEKEPTQPISPCAGPCLASVEEGLPALQVGSAGPSQGASPTHFLNRQQTPVLWGSLWSQTPVGRPHAQMELKAQLVPGLRKKSWNLSSQLHKQCFYTHNRLCNLSPWKSIWMEQQEPSPSTTMSQQV